MANMSHGLIGSIRSKGNAPRDVIVVTVDQRNHGPRKTKKDTLSYNKNPWRLVAMTATLTGGMQDQQLIMDYLEDYAFPMGGRKIVEFMITGVSLGGHVVWRLMQSEYIAQLPGSELWTLRGVQRAGAGVGAAHVGRRDAPLRRKRSRHPGHPQDPFQETARTISRSIPWRPSVQPSRNLTPSPAPTIHRYPNLPFPPFSHFRPSKLLIHLRSPHRALPTASAKAGQGASALQTIHRCGRCGPTR